MRTDAERDEWEKAYASAVGEASRYRACLEELQREYQRNPTQYRWSLNRIGSALAAHRAVEASHDA